MSQLSFTQATPAFISLRFYLFSLAIAKGWILLDFIFFYLNVKKLFAETQGRNETSAPAAYIRLFGGSRLLWFWLDKTEHFYSAPTKLPVTKDFAVPIRYDISHSEFLIFEFGITVNQAMKRR